MRPRVAFYPCCCTDIIEPLNMLGSFADKVVFCDIDFRLEGNFQSLARSLEGKRPKACIRIGDARRVVQAMNRIDVLFYRRDSEGEGGSRLFVLGDVFLRLVLNRFPREGGLIITDGSNSRGSNFKRMTRASGMTKHGWHFHQPPEQPTRLTGAGLTLIEVRPAPQRS